MPFRDPTISRCEFLRRLCAHCALRLLGLRFKRHEVLWRREVCFRVLTPRTPPAANKCVSRPPPHLASPRESLRVTAPNTALIRLQPPASRPLSPRAPGTAPAGRLGWSASLDCRVSWVVLDSAAATRSAGQGCSRSIAWASGTLHRRGASRARCGTRSVACERWSTYTAAQAGC